MSEFNPDDYNREDENENSVLNEMEREEQENLHRVMQQYEDVFKKDDNHNGIPDYKEEGVQRKEAGVLGAMLVCVLCFLLSIAGGYLGARLANKNQPVQTSEPTVIYQNPDNSSTTTIIHSGDAVVSVAEKCADSVVAIQTEKVTYSYWVGQYVTSGSGSGVIISEDGYIVTCNHVIDGARSIKVIMTDGSTYEANLVGSDASNDIAVIKVDARGFKPVTYGSSSALSVGEQVVAIGNPLGTLGGTVTQGIVSAKDREITIEDVTMRLIQTDTAVNPGNSGGALFNMNGDLVGIVNAKSSGSGIEGLGFAIPLDNVKEIISDLIEKGYVTGKRSLGISILTISNRQQAAYYGVSKLGLYVSEISENSLAQEAGFEKMDRIISINDVEVSSFDELQKLYTNITGGSQVNFRIERNGRERQIRFTKE